MQTITIRSLGPITSVDTMEVKDVMIFIGPQASGKSTIMKSIYFFKSLRDDFTRYLIDSIDSNDFNKSLSTYGKRIRQKFLDFWGSSYHMQGLLLQYDYGNGATVSVDVTVKYVNPTFNRMFTNKFNYIVSEARRYAEQTAMRNPKFLSSNEILGLESEKRAFMRTMEQQTNELFNDSRDVMFVPAGRSMLATLSDQFQYVQSLKLDYLMNAFIQRINSTKPLFAKSLDALVADRKALTQEKIDFDTLELAKHLIDQILKARYRVDSEGEKLYFDQRRFTKLNYASSGQQESVWILLLIFLMILENRRVFLALEEPEAHLFPEGQQKLVHLLTLVSNIQDNQVIVTTHSPYVLSAYNNLLYAAKVAKQKPDQTATVVGKRLWLPSEKVGAFFVSGGHATGIIDSETGLIRSETVDSASGEINAIFDKLYALEEAR